MSNSASENFGRQKNDEKLKFFIRDTENTLLYSPADYTGNKFFGTWSKVMTLQNMLFAESREKYLNKYAAMLKSEMELESVPICFNACVHDTTTGLNSYEKNCLRDCYLKRVSSRDDFNMLMTQKLALENAKAMRERLV